MGAVGDAKVTWQQSATRMTATSTRGSDDNNDVLPTCEVVGAAGRMASLWLRQEGSIPVSRGVSPGCLSPPNTPIYVATPSKSWSQVYHETIPTRRNDLVWIGNGLLLPEFINSTVVVPHYGILSVGSKPTTTPSSPPTLVYGRTHGAHVARVLQDEGIKTQVVDSWSDIQIHAAQKLLWASCMWLLCHASSTEPLTVQQVHDERQDKLTRLVTELLPALEGIVETPVDLEETLAYLEAYSRSMPGAIPSKELAIEEVKERNGVWLALKQQFPQPFHQELLEEVAGAEVLEKANTETALSSGEIDRQYVRLVDVDLTVWGSKGSGSERCRKAVVIGGGIVGSSVALNLARRGVNVTVLDRLPETELGVTTPASWAWINANNKSPPAYQWLNQLGMRSWRRDSVVKDLPVWNGALVQYKQDLHFLGGYSIEGPLSSYRIQELEPHSNFTEAGGPIYFFADEGSVNPAAAVRSMRQAAKELGVRFMPGQNVTALVRNEEGWITGVESYPISSSPTDTVTTPADVVVVAAGIGSASPVLGGLPLTHRPGQIAFAKTLEVSSSLSLKRILVDTVRESHVLQRRDGTLVAGGGFLEVGGKPSSSGASQKQPANRGSELLTVAAQLAPEPVASSEFTNTEKAVRPMPKDGWPAIGHLEPGLYTVGALLHVSLHDTAFTFALLVSFSFTLGCNSFWRYAFSYSRSSRSCRDCEWLTARYPRTVSTHKTVR